MSSEFYPLLPAPLSCNPTSFFSTSALDPELAQEVVASIRQLAMAGCTMMIATHDLSIVCEFADRVIFMMAGIVVEDLSTEEFFSSPENEIALQFVKLRIALSIPERILRVPVSEKGANRLRQSQCESSEYTTYMYLDMLEYFQIERRDGYGSRG